MNIRIKLTDPMCLPERKDPYDAAYDLKNASESVIVKPGTFVTISTGIIVEFPKTVMGLIIPRSGLGSKYGLRLANTIGLIDPGYRGEIKAVLTSSKEVEIAQYDRFAQLLFMPFYNVSLTPILDIDMSTSRGAKGFGDSGVN